MDIRYIGPTAAGNGTAGPATWPRGPSRPLRPGCSIGHHRATVGSLGGFFRRPGRSPAFVLSNNHVLANEDRASLYDVIVQPAPRDGGTLRASRIGTLAASVPLSGSLAHPNRVDAAICEVDPDVDCAFELGAHNPWIRSVRTKPLDKGDVVVKKAGRSTGETEGVVSAIDVDLWVSYRQRGALWFKGQIEIEGVGSRPYAVAPFAIGGDSGSVIVDREHAACALLFAVSDQGGPGGTGLAYANPIGEVIKSLNLELATPPVSASQP